MKKLVVLLLLPLYLLSVPGLAYSLHFCGKALTSFSFAQKAKKNCPCKKTQSPSDCCQDQQVVSDTDDSLQPAASFKLDAPKLGVLLALLPQYMAQLLALSHAYLAYLDAAFVPLFKIPVYLRLGVFRI